jgi:steroid delta-isomerase-like uncharacterized protein
VSAETAPAAESPDRRPAPDPPRPAPPEGRAPGALVRWTFDMINAHDAEALREAWAPDGRERFPTRTVHGVDDVVSYFATLFAAVPDLTMTMEAMAENSEGQVFVRWRLAGHHTGADYEGLAATGAQVDLDGVDQFTVADGRITSNFVIFDQMQFARQIGLLPAEGSRLEVGLRQGFNLLARRRRH